MENNEIYIDGVNVAECEFLRKCVLPDNEGCKIDDSLCCDVGNCYYKQLQRLKQENEELKKAKSIPMPFIDETLVKELKQENEELKARFNELYNNAEQLANKYNKYDGKKENELVEIINKTTDERNKYKQALEEIREAFRECCNNASFMNNCSEKCKFYKSCNGELSAVGDKINEALND